MRRELIFWAGRSAGVAKELYGDLFSAMGCDIDLRSRSQFFNDNEKRFSSCPLLMLSDENCVEDCKQIKLMSPNAKVGLVDYRGKVHMKSDQINFDFCLVNSIEKKLAFHEDFPNVPCSLLVEFPILSDNDNSKFEEPENNSIKIGYHGNIIHLNSCFEIFCGLSAYAKMVNKDIEIILVYDIQSLKKWTIFDELEFPNVKFVHVQWSLENLENMLSKVDLGLCPSLIPEMKLNLFEWLGRKAFLKSKDDIELRFKAASNLGRALLFFQYGKPILAEPTPSMVLAVGQHGERGQLVLGRNSVSDAMRALDELGDRECSNSCREFFAMFSPEKQLKNLDEFLHKYNMKESGNSYPTNLHLPSKTKFWQLILYFEFKVLIQRLGKKIGVLK